MKDKQRAVRPQVSKLHFSHRTEHDALSLYLKLLVLTCAANSAPFVLIERKARARSFKAGRRVQPGPRSFQLVERVVMAAAKTGTFGCR
jgi:hypothetical protein